MSEIDWTADGQENIAYDVPSLQVQWDSSEYVEVNEVLAPRYEGPYAVIPSDSAQVLKTDNLRMENDVTIGAIPSQYIVPSGTLEIIENGTEIDVAGYASADVSVPTFNALSWLGEGAELIATYDKESTKLSSTTYASWTPSTTAKTIKSGATAGTYTIDVENYDYLIRWQFHCVPAYNGNEANTARLVKVAQEIYQAVFKRPSTLANIGTLTENATVCQTLNTPSLMDYWNDKSSHTFTWSASYGIYSAATAATFASTTAEQTTMTVKRPSISARCSTTYFSTANAGKVDQAETYFYTKGYLYRIKKSKSIAYNQYHNVCALYDDGL